MTSGPANRDEIDELLHRLQVHDGFPEHRRKMAIALETHGFSIDDLTLLSESVAAQRRRDSDSVPSILAKLLSNPKSAGFMIADMRRGTQLRTSKAPDTYPGKALWKQPGSDDGLGPDLARNRRIAYALLVVEGKPAKAAAEVIGCTEQQAETFAQEEREDRLRMAQERSGKRGPGSV